MERIYLQNTHRGGEGGEAHPSRPIAMLEAKPSRTALRVALRRAAHQIVDRQPLVFPDPLAIPILGPEHAAELHRTPDPAPTARARPFSAALRAHIVARSRYAEDTLAEAVRHGAQQYVLLGAGLDTFAYRNTFEDLTIFEVDHPATQAWKRTLLWQAGIAVPETLAFVPVDFEQQQLPAELRRAGFDQSLPTVFAWLGVVPYLTLEAFRSTVSYIAHQPGGSALILDYSQPRRVLPPPEQLAHDSLSSRVALAGEPFQLFFTPSEIAAELSAFRSIEDLGATELNARYFARRTDSLAMLGSAGRLLRAWR